MPRIRNSTDGVDAAVAKELAVAERSVRRAMSLIEVQRRAAFGDFDGRRAIARTHRDLERCIETLRGVRPVGTVGGEPEAPPPPRRQNTVPEEVAE